MNENRVQKIKRVASLRQLDLTVVLDNVHDNHNVGAVLRSCDSVGITEIYLIIADEDRQTQHFSLGKRTSMGSRKWIDVHYYHDRMACMNEVKSKYIQIFGAIANDNEVVSLYDLDLCQSTALVFGNESDGISEDVLKHCNGFFNIPQYGMAESLNISVACAISVYEALRQRQIAGLYNRSVDIINSGLHKAIYEEYFRRAKDRDQRKSVEIK